MTRLLVTSDWHGDALTCGVNRFDDVEAGAQETVDFLRTEKVDGYLMLGDLTDPDNVRSYRSVALAISIATSTQAMKVPSIWLAGNHDVIEDGYGTTTLSPLRGIKPLCTVVEQPMFGVVAALHAYFVCFPFVARHQTYDAVEHVADAFEDYEAHGKGWPVIVLSHLNVEGAQTGSESTTLARGRDHNLPVEQIAQAFPDALVLQGHYHKPQVIESHGIKIHIPGSLERLRFDEENDECGFLVVEY